MGIDHPHVGQLSQLCPNCYRGRVDHYVGDHLHDAACGRCGGTGYIFTKAPPPAVRDIAGKWASDIIDAANERMDAAGIPKAKP